MRLEVLLILVLLIVGGLIYYKDGGQLPEFDFAWFDSATSTEEAASASRSRTSGRTSSGGGTSVAAPAGGADITSSETKEKADTKREELDELEDDERVSELYQPVSPYAGTVTLGKGNAGATTLDREYLVLSAPSSNAVAVTITDWTLESYVTGSSAEIPRGARFLEKRYYRQERDIALLPGERAYLLSDDSPLHVSFRENLCTGYIETNQSIYPSLAKDCPLPGDELLRFGDRIFEDDDECYEFVEDIRRCETVDDRELDEARLNIRCDSFIEDVLSYDGCVEHHADDPDFYDTGSWRIYLDASRERWLSDDEIVRLFDEEGRVVDVLEY